jgi:predicted RNase H-related nuclease YkuK (DUF458 family)
MCCSLKEKVLMEIKETPLKGVVSGTWKFRKEVTKEQLVALTKEWMKKYKEYYFFLGVGTGADKKHVIVFVLRLPQEDVDYKKFIRTMLKKFEVLFGKDSVVYHVVSPISIIE